MSNRLGLCRTHRWLPILAAAMMLFPAVRAQAGVWRNVALELQRAGFDLQGQRNVYGNGADVRLVTNFNRSFDFGSAELVLSGPLSIEASTTSRGLDTLDFTIQTALTRDLNPQPLQYVWTADAGGQRTQVSGDVIVDGGLSIDGLGFYSLNFDMSSRQATEQDGRVADGNSSADFDIGPVDLRGNIFIDLVAAILDPILTGAGLDNPLTGLTGADQLAKLIDAQQLQLPSSQSDLGLLSHRIINPGVSETVVASLLGLDRSGLSSTESSRNAAVPEPLSAALMLAGATTLLAGRRRRRQGREASL